MRLDDDGATRGEGARGVAARHGEGEGKVACPEDNDRSERLEHAVAEF